MSPAPRTRRRALVAVGLAAVGLTAPVAARAASTAPAGSYFIGPIDKLQAMSFPSTNAIGDLPDASVYYENGTYYAYSTSSNGSFIPVRTSTDGMKTWQTNATYTRPATAPNGVGVRNEPVFSDGLLGPATWVAGEPGANFSATGATTCPTTSTGAPLFTLNCTHMVSPSVVKITSGAAAGKYLMAYGAWYKTGGNIRMAVTTAIGATPKGPFTDYSTAPIYVGPYGEGSIDPQLFKDPTTSRLYVSWMNQGNPAGPPYDSKVFNQEITVDANGVATKVGSPVQLLSTDQAQAWEKGTNGYGTVVEQPSMVSYGGRYYLFYSSQLWTKGIYRMGYATCNGPMGPCTRASTSYNPLMGSSSPFNADGPGGGSAFIDAGGRLRLAYQAWAYGKPGYSATNAYAKSTPDRQRFGHIAMLDQDSLGNLTVAQRTLAQSPTGCSSTNLYPNNNNWVDMFACQYPAIGPKAPAKGQGTQQEFVRIGGPTSYASSAAMSRNAGFAPGVAEVVLVSVKDPADALAAGAYAADRAPILTVPATGAIAADTKAELARLRPAKVTVLGPTSVIGDDVVSSVRSAVSTATVTRVAGVDRYATAAALSKTQPGTSVYVATGASYPDALSGSVPAIKEKSPVLLTTSSALPAVTQQAIKDRVATQGVTKIVVVGGTGAVSTTVESQLKSLVPGAVVQRLSGADIASTSVATGKAAYPTTGNQVVLTRNNGYLDAIPAMPLAARKNAELLVTATQGLAASTLGEVRRQVPPTTYGVGGLAAVSDNALLHGAY